MDDYTPSRDKLVSRKAIEALIKQLHTTYIYRYAKAFCLVRIKHLQWMLAVWFSLYMPVYCLVSWYLLGWVVQPSTPHLPAQAHSLFNWDVHNANEFGCLGLGMYMSIYVYTIRGGGRELLSCSSIWSSHFLYNYFILEWERQSLLHQHDQSEWPSTTRSPHSNESLGEENF